jgi:monoterpene epsilon-lactone hydrolase
MSWQNAVLSWFLRRRFKPHSEPHSDSGPIDIAALRKRAQGFFPSPKLPSGWRRRDRYRGGDSGVDPGVDASLSGEWIEPTDPETSVGTQPTVLYLHGGGYYFCSPRTHRPITYALATGARARVFALDYRLAPEYPFPAAVDDALAAYRALLEQGIAHTSIVLAGDSAGGGLALATLVALRDAGDLLPAAAVVFSPWTDLAATGHSIVSNTERDVMFHGASIGPAAQIYLGDASATDPLASPLYADLHGLPPLLIQASDSEVLRDDALRFAQRAREAGVEVQLETWPDTPHAWQIFAQWLPEARTALGRACVFITRSTQRYALAAVEKRRAN